MLCALSGYINKDKAEIIYILFVTGLASMIPDVYAYYLMQRAKNISIRNSIIQTSPVALSEMVSTIFISIPLLLFDNKHTRFFVALFIGLILIMITSAINSTKTTKLIDMAEPLIITIFGVVLTYCITTLGRKYLMPIIDRRINN
jgi:fumarate reductase subunit C